MAEAWQISRAARRALERRLEPGEQILWTGRPVHRHLFQAFIGAVVITFFALMIALVAPLDLWDTHGRPGLVVGLAISIGCLAALGYFYWAIIHRARTVFAVTDRQAISWGRVWGGKLQRVPLPALIAWGSNPGDLFTVQFHEPGTTVDELAAQQGLPTQSGDDGEEEDEDAETETRGPMVALSKPRVVFFEFSGVESLVPLIASAEDAPSLAADIDLHRERAARMAKRPR